MNPAQGFPEAELTDIWSAGNIRARPERIRLLKFINLFAVGGTERQFVNLGKSLDLSRFALHFACLRRSGELLEELEPSEIPLSEYNIKSLYHCQSFAKQMEFAGYLRRNRIQIVHTYGVYPNLFGIPASKLARVPIIVASIRDTGAYLTRLHRHAQKLVCRLADCIVANADAVRNWLIAEGYDGNKIAVIKNGIELSRFKPPKNGQKLHREIGVAPDAPLVTVLSRLSAVKGIDYFLEAAAIVGRQSPQTVFVIVGEAGIQADRLYRKKLERYVEMLGLGRRVVFVGFRFDVSEVLSESAISVLPSLSEGLSNTVLESMAAGVPVVATRVGGTAEAVADGVTGFVVPPRDSAALARSISVLLENRQLARRFGEAGKQRVARSFSLERMVRETEQLYVDLIKSAGLGSSDGYDSHSRKKR